MKKRNCVHQRQRTLAASIKIMTKCRKKFLTFYEQQHFAFVYLLVSCFLFSSLNFRKRCCDKASTEQSDYFK